MWQLEIVNNADGKKRPRSVKESDLKRSWRNFRENCEEIEAKICVVKENVRSHPSKKRASVCEIYTPHQRNWPIDDVKKPVLLTYRVSRNNVSLFADSVSKRPVRIIATIRDAKMRRRFRRFQKESRTRRVQKGMRNPVKIHQVTMHPVSKVDSKLRCTLYLV